MVRLILFLLLILVLYYLLHFLIKDMPSRKKKMSRGSEPEELIQDPFCKTYIPKRSAMKKRISGEDFYFCSRECLKKYLQQEKSSK